MDVFDRIVMCLLTPQSLIAQEKTEQQRSRDLLKMGFVAAELARSGAAVIVAPVAPKAASRDAIKNTVLQTAGPGGNFFTVHVATPLEACEEHDRKDVYRRARAGLIRGVAGVDEEYEAPEFADLTVDCTVQNIPEIVHSKLLFICSSRPSLTRFLFRHCSLAGNQFFGVSNAP